jgi:pyruvate dehydrogenase E2 component (dihydrolipoyllysine-residue acetyltransferase)
MAHEVVMPRLGWSMEDGILVQWLKRDGDRVAAGDVICVIESDKAENEVESFESGILRIPPDSPPPGVRVRVGTRLAYILRPGEAMPLDRPAAASSPVAMSPPATSAPAAGRLATSVPARRGAMPPISPRARRVAAELGVEWRRLIGSGRTGRIVERDVRTAVASPPDDGRGRPLGPVRRRVAERMAASARAVAPVTLTTEVDATALVRLRERLAAEAAGAGRPAPSYNDLLAKLVAAALVEHPDLNASLAGEAIVRHDRVNIGLAVETDRGLLACVLRDVQRRPLAEIAAESAALIERARAGRVSPDELRGGTFTITNLGMYGIDAFTPIVNLPECAILGVGRIVARPVVVDETAGTIAARKVLTLSLTFDHRVVDGAPAARFLQRVTGLVERPEEVVR